MNENKYSMGRLRTVGDGWGRLGTVGDGGRWGDGGGTGLGRDGDGDGNGRGWDALRIGIFTVFFNYSLYCKMNSNLIFY